MILERFKLKYSKRPVGCLVGYEGGYVVECVMVTNTTCTTELVETGEKRDRMGRKITPTDRRVELVAAFKRSGLTQAEFARRECIRYTTFCSWMQQSRRVRRTPLRFAEVKIPAAASSAALEVRLTDGTVVRGASAPDVAAVVRALKG